jgi:hypothetical protein
MIYIKQFLIFQVSYVRYQMQIHSLVIILEEQEIRNLVLLYLLLLKLREHLMH